MSLTGCECEYLFGREHKRLDDQQSLADLPRWVSPGYLQREQQDLALFQRGPHTDRHPVRNYLLRFHKVMDMIHSDTILLTCDSHFSVLSGLCYDRLGARTTILAGGVGSAISLAYFWVMEKQLTSASGVADGLIAAVQGLSSAALFISAIGPSLANFDEFKGMANGAIAAVWGIAPILFLPAIYSRSLVWLISGIVILVTAGIAIPLTSIISDRFEARVSYLQINQDDSFTGSASPVLLRSPSTKSRSTINAARSSVRAMYSDYRELVETDEAPDLLVVDVLPEYNPLQILLTVEFWSLAIIMFAAEGAAVTHVYNMKKILVSESAPVEKEKICYIIYTVVKFVSSLFFGLVSDRIRGIVHVPGILFMSLVFTASGYLMMTINGVDLIQAATGMISVGNGAAWSIILALVSDLWGTKFFGTNLSMLGLFMALGGYLLPFVLTEKNLKNASQEEGKCTGTDCFHKTFLFVCIFCTAALLPATLLYIKTRRLYNIIDRNIKNNPSNSNNHVNSVNKDEEALIYLFSMYNGVHKQISREGTIHVNLSQAIRVGQGSHVKIELSQKIPIQVDGEPWLQARMLYSSTESRIFRGRVKSAKLTLIIGF
ncbi:Nodulin-like protein, partial [Planoprotostelium fungivorum]